MHNVVRIALAAVTALLFAACPGGQDEADAGFDSGIWYPPGNNNNNDGGTDGGNNNTGPRTVVVTSKTTHITSSGETVVPTDLTTGQYAALVWNGSSFDTYPGTGKADGTVTIPNVPGGKYYLKWQRGTVPVFIVTGETNVDLGGFAAGRPDEQLSDAGTTLNLNASGLPAWELGSQLQVISANANVWGFYAEGALQTQPTDGVAPSMLDFSYPDIMATSYGYNTPLVQAAKGDDFTVTLMTPKPYAVDGGTSWYVSVDRAFSTNLLTVQNGIANNLPASFSQPAVQQTASLDWRRSQFDSLRAQVHPSATFLMDWAYVMALPHTSEHGFYSSSADLAYVEPDFAGDAVIPLSWRNPFGSDWVTAGSVGSIVAVYYPQTDGGSLRAYGYYLAYDTMPELANGPVTPKIGPVTNFKVNGNDASATQTINATPQISWTAPTLGVPSRYRVELFRLYRDTAARRVRVGRFFTRGTDVHVPAGILEAGQRYAVVITAIASATDLETKPFVSAFPEYSMDAISGLLTVQ